MALTMFASAILLAGCGTVRPASVSGLGDAAAKDALGACGLSRADQGKIDATSESLIRSGAWERPAQSMALACEDRRQRERADGRLKPRSKPLPAAGKPIAGAPWRGFLRRAG